MFIFHIFGKSAVFSLEKIESIFYSSCDLDGAGSVQVAARENRSGKTGKPYVGVHDWKFTPILTAENVLAVQENVSPSPTRTFTASASAVSVCLLYTALYPSSVPGLALYTCAHRVARHRSRPLTGSLRLPTEPTRPGSAGHQSLNFFFCLIYNIYINISIYY